MKRKQAIKKSKKIQRLAKGQAMGVYTIRLPQELIAYCENVGSDKIREMINYNKQAGAGHTDVVMDDKNNPHLTLSCQWKRTSWVLFCATIIAITNQKLLTAKWKYTHLKTQEVQTKVLKR